MPLYLKMSDNIYETTRDLNFVLIVLLSCQMK